jgi:hypothetical protein
LYVNYATRLAIVNPRGFDPDAAAVMLSWLSAMKNIPAVALALLLAAGTGMAEYLITTSDSLLNNGADYLVITHENFAGACYPLCRLRDSLGLEVKMAETRLIYSTFNTGPRADRIKAFTQRVHDYWRPRPRFVLLVGDACKDTSAGDFVPCKRFPAFSYGYTGGLTEHAIDNWYAQLSGQDSIPDLVIGRLPVNTLARAESLVAKVLRYEARVDTGSWLGTTLVPASTDRAHYADWIDSVILRPMGDSVYKVYESQGNSAFLRHKTVVGFNQGASLVCQCSHGSQPPAWTGSRTLFSYLDVDSLTNLDALPIVLGRG